MQTFLPTESFTQTAKILDYRRLGKQRVETKQILTTLFGESNSWKNHPAVLMWKGYEHALTHYGATMCVEWRSRGYIDNMLPWFTEQLHMVFDCLDKTTSCETELPSWFGDEMFHQSHRSMLVRKKPEYYKQYWPDEDGTTDYYWPSKVQR